MKPYYIYCIFCKTEMSRYYTIGINIPTYCMYCPTCKNGLDEAPIYANYIMDYAVSKYTIDYDDYIKPVREEVRLQKYAIIQNYTHNETNIAAIVTDSSSRYYRYYRSVLLLPLTDFDLLTVTDEMLEAYVLMS